MRYLIQTQLENGGWPIYSGGPADQSASVKAYFALKLCGVSAEEPFMERARRLILDNGGVVTANVFSKIALALFGQYDWRGIPSMPAEIILAPQWFYFNIYAVSLLVSRGHYPSSDYFRSSATLSNIERAGHRGTLCQVA